MTKLVEVVYHGVRSMPNDRGHYKVTRKSGKALGSSLNPRHDLRNHSSGFGWGYLGSGPAQLALGLLSDALPEDVALPESFGGKNLRKISDHDLIVEFFYERFKTEVVAKLPHKGWELERSQILNWLNKVLRQEFVVTLKQISNLCNAVVQWNIGGLRVQLKTLSNGQLRCYKCERIWDRDDGLSVGDDCPNCSDADIYNLDP